MTDKVYGRLEEKEKSRLRREMTLKKKKELMERAEREERKEGRKGSKGSKEVTLNRHPWCFICGVKGVILELHHIKPVRNGGSSKVGNTCLLCDDCHVKYHKKFDKKLDEVMDLSEEETYKVFLEHVKQMNNSSDGKQTVAKLDDKQMNNTDKLQNLDGDGSDDKPTSQEKGAL